MKDNFAGFYKGKVVLVTGHTGFKGSWLSIWLRESGAKVIGYALDPKNENDLFNVANLNEKIVDIRGDVRDLDNLKKIFKKYKPEIVFHLAAQPLVRDSYERPHYTFETNILGVVNVLECIRESKSVKSAVIITTDKCYKNKEQIRGYKEIDELGGHDPYSSSKACVELVVESYNKSFFENTKINIASARAGNVLGGGDWSEDRIIPDSIKALLENKKIIIRNPDSTRPWQHVLDPLSGYLLLAKNLYTNKKFVGAWNFGPDTNSILTVKKLVELLISYWGAGEYGLAEIEDGKHESRLLSLNTDKARLLLNWRPMLDTNKTIKFVVDWYKRYDKEDPYKLCVEQINEFCSIKNK